MSLYRRIIFSLLFTMLPVIVNANNYDFKTGGLCYQVISLEDRTCAVVRERDESGHVVETAGNIVIPSYVEFAEKTFTVVKIADGAFERSSITSVVVGGTVRTIGSGAFANCDNLKRAVIESGVQEIDSYAFYHCGQLESLQLPNTLQIIGFKAFEECTALKGIVDITSWCQAIGVDAFSIHKEALGIAPDLSICIQDSRYALKIYRYGLNVRRGESIYIGRNLNLDVHVNVYKCFNNITFGNLVTEMPRYYPDPGQQDGKEVEIAMMTIGTSIKTVPSFRKEDIKDRVKIQSIIVNNTVPPTAEGFDDNTYANAVLYVPDEALSLYKSTEVWKNFWEIKGLSILNESPQFYEIAEPKDASPLFMGADPTNVFAMWVMDNLGHRDVPELGLGSFRTVVQFTVMSDGGVGNIVVLEGENEVFNQIVIKTITSSPKWTPARINGEPVEYTYTFPVILHLN